MPPKKCSAPAPKESKKSEQKKKEKIIEDKSFGLKNKKGSKQQKFITQMHKQVANDPNAKKNPEANAKTKKQLQREKQEEWGAIFRPVMGQQQVGFGVDPKSVVCMFFKQGLCTKGDKCKFSHDLAVERKTEKKNLFVDEREDEDEMNDWDDAQLQDVVAKRHGEAEKLKPKTAIICKHFLDAVEEGKYGWFWECPNGNDKCHYRHALPPGFVLKKDKQKAEAKEKVSIEELIEKERAALGYDVTPVTWETFRTWKNSKRKERESDTQVATARKRADFQSGKADALTGRELFAFNPDMAEDDDFEAADTSAYVTESKWEQEQAELEAGVERQDVRTWTLEALEAEACEIAIGGGTVRSADRKVPRAATAAATAASTSSAVKSNDDANHQYDDAIGNAHDVNLDDVDLALFEGEGDDALERVQEELYAFDLSD